MCMHARFLTPQVAHPSPLLWHCAGCICCCACCACRSAAAISELVSTPQFRHQLDLFSHALMTGQLDTAQFGLPPGGGFGVLDFLGSIQRHADQQRQQQQQGGGQQEAKQQQQQQQPGL